MNTILAPVDFSDVTDQVISQAMEQAKAHNALLRLLYVMDFVGEPFAYMGELGITTIPPGTSAEHDALEHARERMRELESAVRSVWPRTDGAVLEGPVIETILHDAHNTNAMFVIIGSHGHGSLFHLLLGGICEGVLRKAECPVMVVRAHAARAKESEPTVSTMASGA